MVLLDDSNSYWWLVRVVKDGSIGYLPAEHIETPTERLARLNKHRNVDLSATMLGDNNEKSKNPLKKAMRRRNAKTVNFGAPMYIDASDVDYSSDEDSEHGDFFNDDETLDGEEEDVQDQAEDIVVEPLRPKGQKDKSAESSDNHGSHERQDSQLSGSEKRPSSEEFFEAEGKLNHVRATPVPGTDSSQTEPTVSRSRNGTVRNTDSFFKDDTAEPKKISLTPNLLRDARDENGLSTLAEWKEVGSFALFMTDNKLIRFQSPVEALTLLKKEPIHRTKRKKRRRRNERRRSPECSADCSSARRTKTMSMNRIGRLWTRHPGHRRNQRPLWSPFPRSQCHPISSDPPKSNNGLPRNPSDPRSRRSTQSISCTSSPLVS